MSTPARSKVESLTSAQEDALRAFHAEWYRYGTCTDRSDRPATEAAITRMYEMVGKPAPRFLWTDSPATGALAAALLSGKFGQKPGRSISWDSLRGPADRPDREHEGAARRRPC